MIHVCCCFKHEFNLVFGFFNGHFLDFAGSFLINFVSSNPQILYNVESKICVIQMFNRDYDLKIGKD